MFFTYISGLANMCLDVTKQWFTSNGSAGSMGKAELGGHEGENWSEDLHSLFDDLVETII